MKELAGPSSQATYRVSAVRIAFDLDETLGVPIIEGATMRGWQLRPGCPELLARLQARFVLCL